MRRRRVLLASVSLILLAIAGLAVSGRMKPGPRFEFARGLTVVREFPQEEAHIRAYVLEADWPKLRNAASRELRAKGYTVDPLCNSSEQVSFQSLTDEQVTLVCGEITSFTSSFSAHTGHSAMSFQSDSPGKVSITVYGNIGWWGHTRRWMWDLIGL